MSKMSTIGKTRRLGRIFRQDERTVIIPMDHGVTLGPVTGLVDMQAIIDKLVEGGGDAVVIHKGIAAHVDTRGVGLIIHASASTSLGPYPDWKVRVCSAEEALRLGADALSVHVNVGAQEESDMLIKLGAMADMCEAYCVPLLAMMYPRGPEIKDPHDPKMVAHVARLGAELGADVVKTNYTGSVESFREVTEGCPVPVIIAGGPKVETIREVLQMVYDSIEAGGRGVSIGRNVFQHENPTAMVKALVAIVHERASVDEAMKILGST